MDDDTLSAEDREEYTVKITLQRYYELVFQTKKWTVTGTLSGNEHKGPEGANHAWANRNTSCVSQCVITQRLPGDKGIPGKEATKQHEIVCCYGNQSYKDIIDEGTMIETYGDDYGTVNEKPVPAAQGTPTLRIEPGYYDIKNGDVYPHICLGWSIATSCGGRRDSGPTPTAFKGKISGSVGGIELPMWCTWHPDWENKPKWTWSGSVSVVAARTPF
jgi:hypothetical protein